MSLTLSVVCPIYNEERYIAKCIDTILGQDFSHNDWEILFVDGMSTDRTREIVREYSAKYSFIQLLDNPRKIVPPAMNIGIMHAAGEIIIRLDAHAFYPTNYFSVLISKLKELNADNVGAVCRTLPADDSDKGKAIAAALSSSFGMGNSRFRVGAKEEIEVDTVPFGCFRKELFEKIGLYDDELIRNQDDELNGRIIKNGGKIYLLPDLIVDYFARDSIRKTGKMFYQYGLFKPLVNKKLGLPATVRQFFPSVFVLGLILGLIASVFSPLLRVIYISILVLYVLLAIVSSLKTTRSLKQIFYQVVTYFVIHVNYGCGYLIGIYKILIHQSFVVKVNR